MADDVAIRFILQDDGKDEAAAGPSAPAPRPGPTAPAGARAGGAVNIPQTPIAPMLQSVLDATNAKLSTLTKPMYEFLRDAMAKSGPEHDKELANFAGVKLSDLPPRAAPVPMPSYTAAPAEAKAKTPSWEKALTQYGGSGSPLISAILPMLGPAALAVTGALVASKLIGHAGNAVRGAIGGPADVAKQAVAGDEVGAAVTSIEKFGDTLQDVTFGLPNPASEMVKTFGKVARSGEELTKAFLQRAHEIAPYSGAIASAEGRQTVREIMANIKEGQQLGESYAGLMDAWGDLKNELRNLLMPIKGWLLEKGTLAIQFLTTIVEALEAGGKIGKELMVTAVQLLVDIATVSPVKFSKDLAGLPDRIAAAMKKADATKQELPSQIEDFFNSAAPPSRPDYTRKDPINNAGGRLNIPAFAGL